MKIGISINGVLRNYFKQIEVTHSKYFPPEEGEDGIKVLDYDLDKWVTFPTEKSEQAEIEFDPNFDPFSSKSRDSVEDLDLENVDDTITLNEFMYERCTLEIFGSAGEMVKNAMNILNNLILDYPEHEFVVISRETGLSVPSTYFFLSKTSCMSQEVRFVTDSKDSWEYVDMMVTDHPDVINSKPENKICVIVDKPHNQKVVQSNIRITTIKELGETLENLKEPVQ
jgi:hypothetical protein|tara:strand:+ start:499 stop:1176 length:678 start_codon:yes stop_codon:yes gene_type:complete